MDITKLGSAASRVRTPLMLAALALMVMYLLLRQMLKLDVFANMGGERTYLLFVRILTFLFWLALVAIVLAVASFVLPHFVGRKSDLRIIDASQDDEHQRGGRK